MADHWHATVSAERGCRTCIRLRAEAEAAKVGAATTEIEALIAEVRRLQEELHRLKVDEAYRRACEL